MTATTTTPAGDPLPVRGVDVAVHRVDTDRPESDGTIAWADTTIVVVQVHGDHATGLGYTYGHAATAGLIRQKLAGLLLGADALDVRARWLDLYRETRNLGRPGIASHAISALDVALWDLKARHLGVPLAALLGAARGAVPVYGSGGFTSYTLDHLRGQLAGWVDQGLTAVKIKVGRHPDEDAARVAAARGAIGPEVELFVDANGAYSVQQALRQAAVFADHGVTWFEEPVSSDDLTGLRHVRERVPAGMEVAAGEYAYDVFHVRNLLAAEAVDVVQADVTRCGGITGFLDVASLCWAHDRALSAHTAPQLTLAAGAAAPRVRHLEWFHDHVRIESRLFDGTIAPVDGALHPDRTRPGHGLALSADAATYRVEDTP